MDAGKIKNLIINGETLHQNPLINNKSNHKFIELSEMEALYNFKYHAAEGACKVKFGFGGYFKKRLTNIEFTVDIPGITLKDEYSHLDRNKISIFLLKEFEKFKLEKYNWFVLQNLSQQYTPPKPQ